jgi:C1A family cysteine protease
MSGVPGGGGWTRDKPDPRDYLAKPTKKRGASLGDLDLRKTGFLPPVYQQYDTQSCTSMCVGAAIEYMNMKEGKPVFKPSKLFMYWNGREIGNCTNEDGGAEIRDVMKSLTRWGCAPDADFPFLRENLMVKPPEKAYQDAKKEIITQYHRITSTLKDVTACLSRGQPVVFGASMFANFEEEETTKTGYIKMPKGKEIYGHCMLIVGIQTSNVIVRNSYGVEWGEQGYGYMPVEYMENDNLTGDFWTIDVV